MSRRIRLALLIGITLSGIIILIYLISWSFLMSRFTAIEREDVRKNASRIQNAVYEDFEGLSQLVPEWAKQNVTYDFMKNRDVRFIFPVIQDATFDRLRLNYLIIMASNGEIVFSKHFNRAAKKEQPIPLEFLAQLRKMKLTSRFQSGDSRFFGIVKLGNTPVVIAACPVLKSDGTGPALGMMILGRYFDRLEIDHLQKLTGFPVKMMFPAGQDTGFWRDKTHKRQIVVQELSNRRIAGFFKCDDIYGKPAFIIETISLRLFVQQGRTAMYYFLFWLFVIALFFGVAVYFLLDHLILSKKGQQETEERFRTFANGAFEGIILINITTKRIMESNPSFRKMLGYTAETLKHLSFGDLVARDIDLDGYFQKTIDEKHCMINEATLIRSDRTPLDVEISLTSIAGNGAGVIFGIVLDISERKKAEDLLRKNYLKLQSTLDNTVTAIATLAEKRDPYTAGHQKRVAELAVAIGRDMGFSDEQLEGLQVAGLLHDIGKIYVPAEILSKPGRLSPLEFNIVQTHSQVAYDILKDIPFERPIAQIVLNHHERMNGTGYPNGISGDAIPMESRILAVADVVEAIAFHRPYRPALGIAAAVEEITKFKGVQYDPDVVDACCKIVLETNFHFE